MVFHRYDKTILQVSVKETTKQREMEEKVKGQLQGMDSQIAVKYIQDEMERNRPKIIIGAPTTSKVKELKSSEMSVIIVIKGTTCIHVTRFFPVFRYMKKF